MTIPRYCLVLLLAALIAPNLSLAEDVPYHYISATDLEARLTAGQPINIVDIQVEEEFTRHHIKGATPTYAYPVKSDADRARLDASIDQLNANSEPVVIVCPRGGGGAKRTYAYLVQQGIPAERLLILENGQDGWTCAPLTESE